MRIIPKNESFPYVLTAFLLIACSALWGAGCNGGGEEGDGAENADVLADGEDGAGDDTFYHAVTAEEHSGIESRQLSEILEVTVSGGTVTAATVVQSQGQTGFWTVPPAVPAGFTVEAQPTAGQYRLTWTEPADTKIRYYNIYYATDGSPPASQPYRIASIPTGFTTWFDWLADPGATACYGITSVDRYGNESSIIYP